MDHLVIRIVGIFVRHAGAFDPHRMARMADAELEQATEPLRRELRALLAEYGRDAVTRPRSRCRPSRRSSIDAAHPSPRQRLPFARLFGGKHP